MCETVLSISKDLILQDIVTRILSKQGYRVFNVTSAAQAFDVLDNLKPDVVLCDISLSSEIGLNFVTVICAHSNSTLTPVIIISAFVNNQYRFQIQQSGTTSFITKPFTPRQLLHQVRQTLERSAMLS